MTSALEVYLRNHEAAAQAGLDLFRRASRNQRDRSYGPVLAELRDEVADDLSSLRGLMSELGVRPDLLLGLGLRAGERLARLKPNGGLVGRMPLSDLIEVEAMSDAVQAKLAGWRALVSAGVPTRAPLTDLIGRAERQSDELRHLHRTASEVLTT